MSGALCIRYGRTLLLLCKKCGGTVRAPAPAFPALERPAALPPPAGSRPVPAAPTAGREIPVPQGLRFSAYRPAAFFAPARDVKAAASPRPPNFHGPIGKTAGQVYQTTISDSGISFAGITPESPGTVGKADLGTVRRACARTAGSRCYGSTAVVNRIGNGRLSRAATRSCFRAPLQSCPIPFSRIRWRARRIPST